MIVPWPVEQNGKAVPLIGRKGKPSYILEKPEVLHPRFLIVKNLLAK